VELFRVFVYLENRDKPFIVCYLRGVFGKSKCERCAIWRSWAFWRTGKEGCEGELRKEPYVAELSFRLCRFLGSLG